MPKPTHKSVKFSAAEMADEGTDELDFKKLVYIGRGPAAIQKAFDMSRERQLAKRGKGSVEKRGSPEVVVLDPDVADLYRDADRVDRDKINEVLRLAAKIRSVSSRSKHSRKAKV
jgi:hypothetical protein